MPRILTGIQSTATPHLGNLLGAIVPAIQMANYSSNESFLFIANMHTLTQIKDAEAVQQNTYATAAAWLAFGLDPKKTVFYRQSDVPQVAELFWYLNCFYPYQRLTLAHSFKDKASRLDDVNAGLFTYPMLMAADILLYDADTIPVGKDQLQHIEMARDVATRFHAIKGPTFVIPEGKVHQDAMLVPGTDGEKMSKSRKNTIDIFVDNRALRKQVMGIKTDSTPLEAPKDWSTCNCFALYRLLASSTEVETMKAHYKRGYYGYGDAKQALFDLLTKKFAVQRERYHHYMKTPSKIDEVLALGAEKAKRVANGVLERVRARLGY